MANLAQKPLIDINKLKRASELKGKITDLFTLEELRTMAENMVIPHYVLTNPLDGKKVTLFLQDEVNYWVAESLQKNEFVLEQSLTFIDMNAGAHKIRSTDKVPAPLAHIKHLYWLPDYRVNTPPGIYFLCQGDSLVYIGQATNIGTRISQHVADPTKVFTSTYFINCHIDQLDEIEQALIKFFKPKFNHTYVQNPVRQLDTDVLRSISGDSEFFSASPTVFEASQKVEN